MAILFYGQDSLCELASETKQLRVNGAMGC